MTGDLKENTIEWYTGDDFVNVYITQKKYITKVRKMSIKYPLLVSILHENSDGSITARLPLKAVKLSIISTENRDFSNMFGRGGNDDE